MSQKKSFVKMDSTNVQYINNGLTSRRNPNRMLSTFSRGRSRLPRFSLIPQVKLR